MAKLIEQKSYALIMDQDELNILYHMMIDSSYINEDIVVNIADVIVNYVTNIKNEECYSEDEDDIPF